MINIQRLIDLRELNGFSRKELAKRLSVTEQNVWQYENGLNDPSFVILTKLTELFSVSPNYLFNMYNIPRIAIQENLTYRTKRNQPTKPDKYELKYIDFIHYYIEYFSQFVTIDNRDLTSIQYSINREYKSFMTYEERMNDMENLASQVRSKLEIQENKKLMYTLEQYGVYILERELPDEKDAYSIWANDTPYIVLNKSGQSEARRTYSLAHELGHLLMHRDVDISELTANEYSKLEKEANQFASCLLLPREEIMRDFKAITKPSNPKSYLSLKDKYHVSIVAIEYRCYKLGLLSTSQNSYFYRLLNKYNYRINEPLDDKWALTVPGKILYMFDFVLNNCISQNEVLVSNEIKGDFLNKLFGLRKPIFSNQHLANKIIKIKY